MLRPKNLSYMVSGVMVLWMVILFARIGFGNQLWQDIFQILVGVLHAAYGLALVQNWRGALISRSPSNDVAVWRYKLAGYLWMFGGIGIAIAAVILMVAGIH